jgi:putative cardiolipin synthase
MMQVTMRKKQFGRWLKWAAIILILVGAIVSTFSSLMGLPDNDERPRSDPVTDTSDTRLGRLFDERISNNHNKNGIIELPHGRDAYAARAVLARAADKSIDTQYYMWRQDTVGRLLIFELIKAANRGVRVRLLVDDMYGVDGQDTWLAMDVHPNIEVRLFAPYSRRQPKYLQFLTRFKAVNARMHTKTYTADNQATIVGGRNIGSEYFDADPKLAFADNDVMAVGPAVAEVSAEFNDYWNSDYAYPVTTLADPASESDLTALKDGADDFYAQSSTKSYTDAVKNGSLAISLRDGTAKLEWGPGTIIHDSWRKRDQGYEGWKDDLLISQLTPHITAATEDLIIISPYFVPGEEDVEIFCQLSRKGVKVRILTNSLASNDVAAVHAGYSKHRKSLLRCGVELYELDEHLRADERRAFDWLPGLAKSSLHAKTMVIDKKKMFVGSFNYDQRSLYLNTEIGIVFEQAEISGRAADKFHKNIEDVAFRLELITADNGKESLRWHSIEDGKPVIYDKEPNVGNGTRLAVWFMRLLPIDWLL